ncbi:ribosomal-protein-alanine N-acetyltransferase [Salinivibrio kushneri]|uniref:[Ribosomal protein bS18]-alanine N-acetyltransferase n=1 Tax=Salinivibrio kushneri TaxID=1908198 RepID=A0AB36K4M3_9GAMM|nr:ribosomal protein S18-alanine N-acetyltransferase [Salinivibrio kushneri]OOE43367.1 ribosomal-protein-alanine N-acetyltransferase [Salinivibrio kushneri]OOE46815.1 ribosomal-protein-alanine N-acetyltransferase [Salinivibrio kushneri]
MSDYQITPLDHDDVAAVTAIEQRAHLFPWSAAQLAVSSHQFDHHYVLRLATAPSCIIGYFYARCIAGEAELLNIAIDPDYQEQGWGWILLNGMITTLRHAGADSIWLEVRESNMPAKALYQKHGFQVVHRRQQYYRCADGCREDAWIMEKRLP